MDIGTVYFWKQDFNNPKNVFFGWGFISPDGCGNRKNERVYFNETRINFPVKVGDRVKFEIFKSNGKHADRAARTVEKIYGEEDQAATSNPLHKGRSREEITTIPGEGDCWE